MTDNKDLRVFEEDFETLVLENRIADTISYVSKTVARTKKLLRETDIKATRRYVDSEKSRSRWIIEKVENAQKMEYYVGYYTAFLEAAQYLLSIEEQQEQVQQTLIEYSDSISHFDDILSCIKSARRIRHSHLAERIGIKNNTLTDIMEKICQTGLVAFTRSGRLKHYYLTNTGIKYEATRQIWKKQIHGIESPKTSINLYCYNNEGLILTEKGKTLATNTIPQELPSPSLDWTVTVPTPSKYPLRFQKHNDSVREF